MGSILRRRRGVLLIIGVFVPYFEGEDLGSVSLWNAYSHLDIVYIVLAVFAMALATAAFLTGGRARSPRLAVGLFALGLTLLFPIESAFHWGDFGVASTSRRSGPR